MQMKTIFKGNFIIEIFCHENVKGVHSMLRFPMSVVIDGKERSIGKHQLDEQHAMEIMNFFGGQCINRVYEPDELRPGMNIIYFRGSKAQMMEIYKVEEQDVEPYTELSDDPNYWAEEIVKFQKNNTVYIVYLLDLSKHATSTSELTSGIYDFSDFVGPVFIGRNIYNDYRQQVIVFLPEEYIKVKLAVYLGYNQKKFLYVDHVNSFDVAYYMAQTIRGASGIVYENDQFPNDVYTFDRERIARAEDSDDYSIIDLNVSNMSDCIILKRKASGHVEKFVSVINEDWSGTVCDFIAEASTIRYVHLYEEEQEESIPF